jgi:hypothetical protein
MPSLQDVITDAIAEPQVLRNEWLPKGLQQASIHEVYLANRAQERWGGQPQPPKK